MAEFGSNFMWLEVDPGHSGIVYSMLEAQTGADLGIIVATVVENGLDHVPPASNFFSPFPDGKSFEIKAIEHTTLPPLSTGIVYQSESFEQTPQAPLAPGGGWWVQQGAIHGWAFQDGDHLVFVQSGSTAENYKTGATFTWDPSLKIPAEPHYLVSRAKAQ
jgi:hypothetical protein